MNIFKAALSFHMFDVVGIICGCLLVTAVPNIDALLEVLMSYSLYLFLFLIVFIAYFWLWILIERGEKAYLKGIIFAGIGNYVRTVLATVCVVGIYMLNGSLS